MCGIVLVTSKSAIPWWTFLAVEWKHVGAFLWSELFLKAGWFSNEMHIDFVGKILIWKKCKHFQRQHSCFQTTLLGDLVYDKYLGMKKNSYGNFFMILYNKKELHDIFSVWNNFWPGTGEGCTMGGGGYQGMILPPVLIVWKKQLISK